MASVIALTTLSTNDWSFELSPSVSPEADARNTWKVGLRDRSQNIPATRITAARTIAPMLSPAWAVLNVTIVPRTPSAPKAAKTNAQPLFGGVALLDTDVTFAVA